MLVTTECANVNCREQRGESGGECEYEGFRKKERGMMYQRDKQFVRNPDAVSYIGHDETLSKR